MIPDSRTAAQIRNLMRASPGAVQLTTYVSLAIRIESELLRALRLDLAPHLDVGCEADLWHSRLVLATGPSGITLRPEVAEVLRGRLRDDVDRRVARQAWQIIQEVHADTSPAILLEEAIAWYAIDGSGADIETGLTRALKTMVEDPDRGLAAWWMRARRRLPAEATSSSVANALDRVAMGQLENSDATAALGKNARFEQIVRNAGTTKIFVRCTARAVELGEFEPDVSTRSISVPDLDPIRIEVSWNGGKEATLVSLGPGRSQLTMVDPGTVRLKTERGDVYELLAMEPAADPAMLPPLTGLLQCGASACARGFDGLETPAPEPLRLAVERLAQTVGEYLDPPWQRGLRLLADRFVRQGLPEPAFQSGVSEFARQCIELAVGEGSDRRLPKRLSTLARRLDSRLAAFDTWDPAEVHSPDPDPEETGRLIAEVEKTIEKVVGPDDPLRRLGAWLEAYVAPTWHRSQRGLLESEIWQSPEPRLDRFVGRVVDEVTTPVDRSSMARYLSPVSINRDSLGYVRRHRPELDLFPEPALQGFRLEGTATAFLELTRWAKESTVAALEVLISQRRAAARSVDRRVTGKEWAAWRDVEDLLVRVKPRLRQIQGVRDELFTGWADFPDTTVETLKRFNATDAIGNLYRAEIHLLTKLEQWLSQERRVTRSDLMHFKRLWQMDQDAIFIKLHGYEELSYPESGGAGTKRFLRELSKTHWKLVDYIASDLDEELRSRIADEAKWLREALEAMSGVFDIFVWYSPADDQPGAQEPSKGLVTQTLEAVRNSLESSHMGFWWDREGLCLGDEWDEKIRQTIERVDVGMIFLSEDMLKSGFIQNVEAELMERRRKEGMRICPIVVSRGALKLLDRNPELQWIKEYQVLPGDPSEVGLKELEASGKLNAFCKTTLAPALKRLMDKLSS